MLALGQICQLDKVKIFLTYKFLCPAIFLNWKTKISSSNYSSLLKDKICFCTTIFHFWKTKYVFAQLFFITERQKYLCATFFVTERQNMSLPNYFSLLKDKKCLCPTIFPYLQLKFVLCKTKCKVANFCISEVIFCWRKKRKIIYHKTNFKVIIFCLSQRFFCIKEKTKNVFPDGFPFGVSYFFLEWTLPALDHFKKYSLQQL